MYVLCSGNQRCAEKGEEAEATGATGRFEFWGEGVPQLSIANAGPTTKTIVAQNIIKGPLQVKNNAAPGAKVIIVNNADDSKEDL